MLTLTAPQVPSGDCYIGLMSGTSLDGVDGVIASFDGGVRVLAHVHQPFDGGLRSELLALNTPGENELHRAALAANALVRAYAGVVDGLRRLTPGVPVRAIGAHGQTVRHRPGQFDGTGYTLQINAPALLAELTGLAVVADFRSRDLAAGGQAAPLVPAFHRTCFGCVGESRAAVNIGGISNLSLLAADGRVLGFDCGPGNALMDGWIQHHLGEPFDNAGRWAAGGEVIPELLAAALEAPYFALPPPKSTGRDDFHLEWLLQLLKRLGATGRHPPAPRDVQTTLCELSALVIARDLQRQLPDATSLWVCGGGALNDELMRRLSLALPGLAVESSAVGGLPPMQVEATAFAWLARAYLRGEAGNLPSVTGATGPRVLGALYPG